MQVPSDSPVSVVGADVTATVTKASGGSTASTPRPLPHPHPRSCMFCRQRKIKCDRQNPCSNCTRGKLDCSYPAGRGRAAKRPRQTIDGPLLDRLHRLESIIKRLTNPDDPTVSFSNTDRDNEGIPTKESPSSSDGQPPQSYPPSNHPSSDVPIDQQLGRLVIDENESYYVSNILWANLGNEIEELRDMLHEPVSEDEGYAPTDVSVPEMASSLGSSAALLGFRSLSHSLLSYHPPLPQSVALLNIFSENVLPLVHILHMPTTSRMFWDAIASLDSIDKNTEALLFAIYYSAIISMDEDQCIRTLGDTRTSSIEKYRFAIEQALARANLLNTQSIILLQATVIFLSALRNEDDSRTSSSLTSLVYHIARSMGLHRDGTAFGLKPLDTELRRRLWYYICLLDIRSAEFHGYEPIVQADSFDTKPPLNINDSDLNPHMTEPPLEAKGPTEMTFYLIRCEALMTSWKVSFKMPRAGAMKSSPDQTMKDHQVVVNDLKQRLEERYLQYCDTSIPFLLLSSTVARLIVARMWLVVHYPAKHAKRPTEGDTGTRDQLFSTSVEILELSSMLLTHKDITKWTWHSKTHIQWHAVLFVLSEICSRPPSPECDRAWECVNIVHNRWNMKENGKKGSLWRPIKRLMAKARYVREVQKIDPTAFSLSAPSSGSSILKNASPVSSSISIPASTRAIGNETSHLTNMDDTFCMEPTENHFTLSIEDLEVEIFNAMPDGSCWPWEE